MIVGLDQHYYVVAAVEDLWILFRALRALARRWHQPRSCTSWSSSTAGPSWCAPPPTRPSTRYLSYQKLQIFMTCTFYIFVTFNIVLYGLAGQMFSQSFWLKITAPKMDVLNPFSWQRRSTRPASRSCACARSRGRPSTHPFRTSPCTTRSKTWQGQWPTNAVINCFTRFYVYDIFYSFLCGSSYYIIVEF
jgi:hypothetical protein